MRRNKRIAVLRTPYSARFLFSMNDLTGKELKRSLGLLDSTFMVAGSMIGSGIFIVTVFMARDIGSSGYILLLWLLTGFITLSAALSYGELAGMMPNAGGQYVYLQRAFGPVIAFLYGWTVFTVIQTGVIAAVAVAFSKYAAVFFPLLGDAAIIFSDAFQISYAQLLAIASIVLLTLVNLRGVQSGKTVQFVFTSAKLMALFALIVLGFIVALKTNFISENFSNMWNASSTTSKNGVLITTPLAGIALLGALGATLINPLFSSDAWNNVTFIAGEIKQPERNIPRSLFLGTLIVTILYILANVSYLVLLPLKGDPNGTDAISQGIQFASNDRVGSAAASMIFGDSALLIMAGLIMVSTFGCNNGLILSGSRLLYAMSKDKLFFSKAGTLNKNSVPGYALIFQCVWASALCLSGKYSDLLTYSTFASLLFYILTIAGLFILRKKEPNTTRPYKAFGYPVIPALYIIITLAICIDLVIYDARNTGLGLALVASGIPIYYFVVRKKTE